MTEDHPLLVAARNAFQRGFGASIHIMPTDAPPFVIDGGGEVCAVVPTTLRPPDCEWRASSETLMRIFGGGRALDGAYLSGRLSIAGDMSVMARLVLEGPQ